MPWESFSDANGVGDMQKEVEYWQALNAAYERGRKDERKRSKGSAT